MNNLFTNIRIFPVNSSHPSILANGKVLVGGIAEVSFTIRRNKQNNSLFCGLPGRAGESKTNGKTWYSDVRLPKQEHSSQFQEACLAAYHQHVRQSSASEQDRFVAGAC